MGRCIFQKRYLDEQDRHSAKGRVNRISYAYDRGGRLCRVTDSTGAVSKYTYNSRGQRTVVRNKIREDVWQETGYTYLPQPSVRIAKFHLMAAIAAELCEGALQSVEIS